MEDFLPKFLKTIESHVMTIEADSGFNRVLLFKAPSTTDRHFRITTWKEHLCISGDMGDFMFMRHGSDDMFYFFRRNEIEPNWGYWSEKRVATSGHQEYSSDRAKECISEYFQEDIDDLEGEDKAFLQDQVDELLGHADEGQFWAEAKIFDHDIMDDYPDFGECWRPSVPTAQYKWCLHAIPWAIQQYDKHTAK